MSIKRFIDGLSFFRKELLVYVIFAVLPMLGVTFYNYQKTREILLTESHQEMQQVIETTARGLDSTFAGYETVLDLIYANKTIYGYLCADYAELSYWEMFSYIDQQMSNIMVVNPTIRRIRFYSTNQTLPSDNYYFYREEELPEGYDTLAETNRGACVAGGVLEEKDATCLAFFRNMNLYASGTMKNGLLLEVEADTIAAQLKQTDEKRSLYLVNADGQILAASGDGMGEQMSRYLPGWEELSEQETKLQIDDSSFVGISRPLDMGMRLILLADQESLNANVEGVTRAILLIFLVSAATAIIAIWLYGRISSERVNKVVYAAHRMGEGRFDYVLTDMGGDEIGQISDAFNLLGSQIQTLIRENYEKQLMLKTSEMNLLQEQINPHFLYNALSVISSTALREGGRRTVASVRYLADFYRISLNKGLTIVTVKEEVELLKNYMKIQKLRFEDMVDIVYDIDEAAYPYRTLRLVLQPLVENAIHHGRREDCVLHIVVRVGLAPDAVIYQIRDDGEGISKERLSELRGELKRSQEGFGLKNVDIRVKLNYGEKYGVTLDSEYGQGTEVTVRIPRVPDA